MSYIEIRVATCKLKTKVAKQRYGLTESKPCRKKWMYRFARVKLKGIHIYSCYVPPSATPDKGILTREQLMGPTDNDVFSLKHSRS